MDHLRRIAAAVAVTGALLHAIAVVGLDGSPGALLDSWVYCAVIIAAAFACLARASLVSEDHLAWSLIGAGLVSWGLSEAVWSVAFAGEEQIPYPSAADVLALLGYPLSIAGLLVLVRGQAPRERAGVALDGAIAAFGAAALGTAVAGPVLIELSSPDLSRTLTDAAYPVLDVAALAAIGTLAATVGWRRDWALLGVGFAIFAAADIAYLRQDASGAYVEGTLLDSAWLVGAAVTALATARPAGAVRRKPVAGLETLVVPGTAIATAIAILVFDHYDRLVGAAVLLAAATLILAIARLALAFAENRALLLSARRDAFTDALTGLANRRRLIEEVEQATVRASEAHSRFIFAIFDLDGFKTYNDTFGHAAGDLLLRRMGASLRAALSGRGQAYRLGGDEFCVLAELDGLRPGSVVAAAAEALREDGEGFKIDCSHGYALIPDEVATPSEALRLADRRLYANKGKSERSLGLHARELLLGVLREREPGLHHHLEGVGALAVALGRRVGLDPEERDVLGRAAELHDIGKMAIPDEILAKPGPLSREEWDLMRTHTLIGERMLNVAPALAPVAKLVRSSHERWDGTGYPDGLAGDEIPIGARIISICDAYEAMVENRPYRERATSADALEELRANAGTQFDPELVELFVAIAESALPRA